MKKIYLIVFLLIIVAVGAGFYYYQQNIYSKEILKLEIVGPEQADLLEEVEYIVKYKNNGDVRLEDPELIFEFPQNSLVGEGGSLRVVKTPEDFGGAIYPGEEKFFVFKTRLLGKEGVMKVVKAELNYRPKNLKASYRSSTTFTTKIGQVPLTFEFDLPSKVGAGKEFKFGLNYSSYVDYPISDLRAVVEYPTGFEFVESKPESLEKNEWDIGILSKADGGRIEVTGKLSGDVGDQGMFKARLGSWQGGEFVLLKEIYEVVQLIEPSLYVTQTINGNPQYIANPGDSLHYEITFKNIGDEFLSNLSLICKLDSKAFNFETLKAPEGNINSGDNTIVFNWKGVPELQFLDEGEEGSIDFWIDLKDEWSILGTQDKNPILKNNVYLSQVKEEFINKINSKLVIEQKGYFEDEVFGNLGPVPPEVGKKTTYTITWSIRNYYNDVDNIKVKSFLPSGVDLTGELFPEEQKEKFSFDSESREIVWDVGDMKMSQGVDGTPSPNVSFQISLTPEAFQRGGLVNLISEARASGEDQWTRKDILATGKMINTTLPDDPSVSDSDGIVK